MVDPVTGKPLHASKLNSVVIGPDVEAEEMEGDITGPEDSPQLEERPRGGMQIIAVIDDPDDITEVKSRLREAWRARRSELGLD